MHKTKNILYFKLLIINNLKTYNKTYIFNVHGQFNIKNKFY